VELFYRKAEKLGRFAKTLLHKTMTYLSIDLRCSMPTTVDKINSYNK